MELKRIARKSLSVLVAGTLLGGCESEDKWQGNIGNEKIEYLRTPWMKADYITIKREDGIIIDCSNYHREDHKIERVEIAKWAVGSNNERCVCKYFPNLNNQDTLKEYQHQFDAYLQKILEVKNKQENGPRR